MMKDIILVCGLGRCGTSLVMRMLYAAGVPVYCEPDNIGNSFESEDIFRLPHDNDWMDGVQGKAIKILDPHTNRPPNRFNYKIIFLTRDPLQQAKSQAKLLNVLMGLHVNRAQIKGMSRGLKIDERHCINVLAKLKAPTLHLRFEDLIISRGPTARKLRSFIGVHPASTWEVMAEQVIMRSPDCYDGMLETKFI